MASSPEQFASGTKSGQPQADRKVKGTIHWVSAPQALKVELRLYDYLFNKPDPDDVPKGVDYKTLPLLPLLDARAAGDLYCPTDGERCISSKSGSGPRRNRDASHIGVAVELFSTPPQANEQD